MEIYSVLTKDHEKVKKILAKLEKKYTDELFQELKKEVIIHAKAEEETFYKPLQKEAAKLKIIVKGGHTEHDIVADMLEQMEKITDEEDKARLLSVIKKSLESHIEMEEDDIYELSKKCFSTDEAKSMGKAMKEKKEELMQEYSSL